MLLLAPVKVRGRPSEIGSSVLPTFIEPCCRRSSTALLFEVLVAVGVEVRHDVARVRGRGGGPFGGKGCAVLGNFVTQYVIPALTQGTAATAALEQTLASALVSVHQGASRVNWNGDPRMIPSVAPQATPIPCNPAAM